MSNTKAEDNSPAIARKRNTDNQPCKVKVNKVMQSVADTGNGQIKSERADKDAVTQ